MRGARDGEADDQALAQGVDGEHGERGQRGGRGNPKRDVNQAVGDGVEEHGRKRSRGRHRQGDAGMGSGRDGDCG